MTHQQIKEHSVSHPFEIFYCEDLGLSDRYEVGWYVLTGDPLINWKSQKDTRTIGSIVTYQNEEEKKVQKAARFEDLKDDYKHLTGTDGSKIDWSKITILNDSN